MKFGVKSYSCIEGYLAAPVSIILLLVWKTEYRRTTFWNRATSFSFPVFQYLLRWSRIFAENFNHVKMKDLRRQKSSLINISRAASWSSSTDKYIIRSFASDRILFIYLGPSIATAEPLICSWLEEFFQKFAILFQIPGYQENSFLRLLLIIAFEAKRLLT